MVLDFTEGEGWGWQRGLLVTSQFCAALNISGSLNSRWKGGRKMFNTMFLFNSHFWKRVKNGTAANLPRTMTPRGERGAHCQFSTVQLKVQKQLAWRGSPQGWRSTGPLGWVGLGTTPPGPFPQTNALSTCTLGSRGIAPWVTAEL